MLHRRRLGRRRFRRARSRSTNPATGDVLGTVPKMGAAETRRAIEAADAALPAWRAKTAKERADILRKWFDLMMANQDDLAAIMTAEQGKPLAERRARSPTPPRSSSGSPRKAKRIYGDVIPAHGADKRIVVIKQPIGVCAAITPWNFPAAMITRKAGPALAAGCTMVLKPASQTPFSALALCELAERAGVPKGVFSCVTGSAGEIGGEMTSNPIVREAHLHRLDRDRQAADGAVRRDRQEDLAGARRQRALHRLRRRRPRAGRRRARSPRSTATPARPASAPTASSSRTASTTRFVEQARRGRRAA